ncbi:MAG TPA: S8 family serine peptidase [Chryseosolibacter sp.]|nr:S8 family serine peptidase [Chryseosolibacter sp.]
MVKSRILCALVLSVSVSFSIEAQQNRYMIFFKDKQGTPQTVDKPIDFLSERAIQRRIEQGIEITVDDLPVSRDYVRGVRDAGADVFFATRWMNGVLVQCDPALLPAIEALPYVARSEFVAPLAPLQMGGRRSFNLRRKNNHTGIQTESQLRMLGIDRMHAEQIRGEGIVIAILDSGFPGVDVAPAFESMFSEERLVEAVSYDFVHNSPNVFQYDDHGTEVLSVIAADIPDAYTGGAPDATFQLFVTEDVPTEYRVEEYNWLFAAEKADSAGVDIIHSSLGYYDFDDASMNYSTAQMDGVTAVVSRAAQWAADRGIVVVTSAGNEGNISSWRIITAPADAKDVIAVGSVTATGQKTSSSSIGPTADNRIKPNLVALGAGVKVVKASGQISTASGTSLAAPLITSLVAGVMQQYPELTNKEIIALLQATASQANNPDNLLGYGIPNFQAVVHYQERIAQNSPFEIYPNPLEDDTLTISPFDPEMVESCEVEIISSQGQIVGSGTVRFDWLNRTYQADLSGMAPGIYFVRIHSAKRRHTFKLVKL